MLLKKLKLVAEQFMEDEIITRSSSLAYYTALAIAPLLILFIWIISLMNLNLQKDLVQDVSQLIGSKSGELIETIVQSANQRPDLSSFSGWVGLLALLISASVIFTQLQETLDLIFDDGHRESDPRKAESKFESIKKIFLGKIFSIGMLLTFLFLAIVSLIVSSTITFVTKGDHEAAFHILNFVVNYFIFTVLFTVIFRWMPKRSPSFKSSFMGGAVTALLFIIGKTAIGIYLGSAGLESAYGAAGSLIVLLAWVFYSSVIFFTGGEIAAAFFIERQKNPKNTHSESRRLGRE